MFLSDIPSQFDDGLHALDLAFDNDIEVFLLDLWEGEEVDRAYISCRGVFRNERSECLIDVFCHEGSV